MITVTQLRASVLLLVVSALALSSVAAQLVTQLVFKAIGDTKFIRVAPATNCALSSDGAHFTGCSSIL